MAACNPHCRPMHLYDRAFTELTTAELYAILRLRSDVFVVEQGCVYPDLDGRDTEPETRHIWLGGDQPACYLRLLDEGAQRRIGRVVTGVEHRGRGHAARLVAHVLETSFGPWVLDAQDYLEGWYGELGFASTGPAFDDDGIMHVPMRRG
jgi:ElaA protein